MNRKKRRKGQEGIAESGAQTRRILDTSKIVPILLVLLGLTVFGIGLWVRSRPPDFQVPKPANLSQLEDTLRNTILDHLAAIELAPHEADRYGRLGIIYEAHGFTQFARLCYEYAVVLEDSNLRWHHHAGIISVMQGDHDRAERAFRHVLSSMPNHGPALEWLGNLLLDRGEQTNAQRCFSTIVRLTPQEPQGYLGLARFALAMDRPADATEYLQEAIRRAPTSGEAHYLLGRAYRKLGRSWDAEVELSRGGDATPIRVYDRWHADVQKARVTLTAQAEAAADLIVIGRVDDAVRELERLRESHPNHVAVLNNLAVAYNRQGRAADAVQLLEAALASGRQHPTILTNLSRFLARMNRLDDALAHADRAARLAPTLSAAHAARGVALTRLNRFEEAIDAFRESARRDVRNPDIHMNLGRVLSHLRRDNEAEAAFEQAVVLAPDLADAHYELANLQLRLGLTDKARIGLQKALSIDPNHTKASESLQSLQAGTSRP